MFSNIIQCVLEHIPSPISHPAVLRSGAAKIGFRIIVSEQRRWCGRKNFWQVSAIHQEKAHEESSSINFSNPAASRNCGDVRRIGYSCYCVTRRVRRNERFSRARGADCGSSQCAGKRISNQVLQAKLAYCEECHGSSARGFSRILSNTATGRTTN
jgi:hypothetical protein